MATLETQIIDEVIVKSRRKMLAAGGAALAGLFLGETKTAHAATYSDSDILNFALNLEYLEANYYTLATAGTTIDAVGIGVGAGTSPTAGAGTVIRKATTTVVPFTISAVKAYALETALEEQKHVTLLRTALGSAAVAQPNQDLQNSFITLGTAIGVPNFDPFSSDANFLLGSYIFEDVGVTAYAGAAALLTVPANLVVASGILAVEAYHAGLIRTTIFGIDTTNLTLNPATLTYSLLTQKISAARAMSDGTFATGADDIGISIVNTPLNNASTTLTGVTLADVNLTNSLAYTRSTNQVLAIVTGGTTGNYKGLFYPAGLNGLFK